MQLLKRRLGLTLVVMVALVALVAPNAHATKRVLLVGDSWAGLMWRYRSLGTQFQAQGVGFATEDGAYTAIGGTTAAFWAKNAAYIQNQLRQNTTIDCVDLVLGGNDLWVWRTSWTQEQTKALLDQVQANLRTVCQACLAVRPNIKVIMHGYDYLNFKDSMAADPFGSAAQQWNNLGKPTPAQLNGLFIGLDERKKQLTTWNSRVKYVQCNGTLQCVNGTSRVIPGQAPAYDPFPGGDPTQPSPIRFFALTSTSPKKYDPIHLTQEGYKWLSYMATAYFYKPYFLANRY
jgi:lysophospholipase L1-like esterase